MRVLIVPDKFKGTLTASAAAGAIANGWWQSRPQDDIECLSMSDGGDGFGAVIASLTGAEERTVQTVDAANRPREATWWFQAETGLAIIESAQIIGLELMQPPGRFHPFELDSRGLGPALRAAWAAGAARVVVGIGGSATNDGGFGLARSLGWQFFDHNAKPVDRWVKLDHLASWQPPTDLPATVDVTVAVDVENPLLGLQGCTRVYGPQKGLRMEQAPLAEACLAKLAELARQEYNTDLALEPGAGAAGGLGFGFRAFVGANLASGFEIFANWSALRSRIAKADLVITAEGMIDRQSTMGKGTGRVATICRELEKNCVGLAGTVDAVTHSTGHERLLFHSLHGIAPGMASPAEAKANAAVWLERLAARVANENEWS